MSSQGPNRPRTPKVGQKYVVPKWVTDAKAWQKAMDEVEAALSGARTKTTP